MRILPTLLVATSVFCLLSASLKAAEPQTLEQAWIQAYQSNPSLEAERAKLRATDEQVSQALSHWRPSIDATGNIGKTYQYEPDQAVLGTERFAGTTRGYGVQATQPLFRGFRTLSETEAAEKQVMAGRAELQSAEQQLLLDTATAFLDIVRDEKILEIDRNNEDVLKQKLDETTARASVGDLTQTDVKQAETRLARSEVNRLQIENTLMTDRRAFARLVGDMPGSIKEPVLTLDQVKNFDDILGMSLAHNPKIQTSQFAYEEAKAEIDLNKGSLLPEVNLVGNVSRNWDENSTLPGQFNSSQILAQLTLPLYRSGADYSKIRAAQQTETQRRMELQDARNHVRESAHNAWQMLMEAEAAIKADQRGVDAAADALEGVKVQSKVGTRTTLDVLNAEQELLDAKTDIARNEHDKNLSIIQIKVAMGSLTADALKLPIDTYHPEHHYDDVSGALIGFGGADEDVYAKEPHAAAN